MDIKVFNNGGRTVDRYLVVIGQHAYLMSHNADSPIGVNTYAGNYYTTFGCDDPLLRKPDWPDGLRHAIHERGGH